MLFMGLQKAKGAVQSDKKIFDDDVKHNAFSTPLQPSLRQLTIFSNRSSQPSGLERCIYVLAVWSGRSEFPSRQAYTILFVYARG